jgi:hypothetical protein
VYLLFRRSCPVKSLKAKELPEPPPPETAAAGSGAPAMEAAAMAARARLAALLAVSLRSGCCAACIGENARGRLAPEKLTA